MTVERKQLGQKGESFALNYLENQGVRTLERNWHCPAGEADIIVQDCGDLVFVEVKTRSGYDFYFPEEAVTRAKRRRYESIAAHYLSQHNIASCHVRFDVISVIITGDNQAFLKHHRDAFCCDE